MSDHRLRQDGAPGNRRGQFLGRLSARGGQVRNRFSLGLVVAGLFIAMIAFVLTRSTHSAENQRDAAASQATSLAAQVTEACNQGGDVAAKLRGIGACEHAQQVIETPVPGPPGPVGPGPTLDEISNAVTDYMIKHPAPAGRGPTQAEITAAVASYMLDHPPTPGRPPTAEEIAGAVSAYSNAHPAPGGPPGRPPTAQEIDQAVASYLATHPVPKGETGAQGPQGPPPKSFTISNGVLGTQTCTRDAGSPDNAATYTCG